MLDVIIGEGDCRMAWNAEVGGWRKAAFSLTSGLITVCTGRRVGGWMGLWLCPHPLIPCSFGRCVYFSPPFPLLPSYAHTLYTAVRFGLELCPFGEMGCPLAFL